MADAVWQARIDLAAALRWAVRYGLHEGICNHFSLMLPGATAADSRVLINPHGLHWSEVRARDVLVLDGEGRLLEGDRPPEDTAFFIHMPIHRAAPHAACVLHTHMPYATALTMVEDGRLEPALQTSLKFLGDVAYDEEYGGLALDDAEGARIARALGGCRVMFLAHHGVIVVGPSIAEAFDDLYYLERACQAQVIAMSTGRPLRRIRQDVARMTREQMFRGEREQARLHFAALKRILDREAPDYAS